MRRLTGHWRPTPYGANVMIAWRGAVVDSSSDSARPDHHAMTSHLGDGLYRHLPGRLREEPAVANYVPLGDVHTYYEEDGQGEPLVLLHPGGADL